MERAFRAWTLLVVAAALVAACSVKDTGAPPLAGPSTLAPTATALFGFTPSSVSEGTNVLFDGSASIGTGAIAWYTWNFDDGTTASGKTVSHKFSVAKTYQVSLTIADSTGKTGSIVVPVTVLAGVPPTALFESSPSAPNVGQNVSFNAYASTAALGRTIALYEWWFGDDSLGSGVTAAHSYAAANTYTVTLRVTDDVGRFAVTSKQISVAAGSQPASPTASFEFSPTTPTTATLVQFNAAASTGGTGRVITMYAWDFGDGTSISGATMSTTSHAYNVAGAGTYVVYLTVTNDAGKTTSVWRTVVIAP